MVASSDSYAKKVKNNSYEKASGLLNSIDDLREKTILKLILETGMTTTELVNAKYSDVDFLENTIAIGSKKQLRTISISSPLCEEIKTFADPKKLFLFSTKQRPQLSSRALQRIAKKYDLTAALLRRFHIQHSLSKKSANQVRLDVGLKRLDDKTILSLKDIEKIRSNITKLRDKILFEIIWQTGRTPKEIVGLQTTDLVGDSIRISSSKFKLEKQTLTQLNKYLKHHKDNFLFSKKGRKLSTVRIFQILNFYGKLLHLPLNPRNLRNTFISENIGSGRLDIANLHNVQLYGKLQLTNHETK